MCFCVSGERKREKANKDVLCVLEGNNCKREKRERQGDRLKEGEKERERERERECVCERERREKGKKTV